MKDRSRVQYINQMPRDKKADGGGFSFSHTNRLIFLLHGSFALTTIFIVNRIITKCPNDFEPMR